MLSTWVSYCIWNQCAAPSLLDTIFHQYTLRTAFTFKSMRVCDRNTVMHFSSGTLFVFLLQILELVPFFPLLFYKR